MWVYLQYAHARLCSILRKAEQEQKVDIEALRSKSSVSLKHPSEIALASEIVRFQVCAEHGMEGIGRVSRPVLLLRFLCARACVCRRLSLRWRRR